MARQSPDEPGNALVRIHMLDDAISMPWVTCDNLLPVARTLALSGHLVVAALDDETQTRLTFHCVTEWRSYGGVDPL